LALFRFELKYGFVLWSCIAAFFILTDDNGILFLMDQINLRGNAGKNFQIRDEQLDE